MSLDILLNLQILSMTYAGFATITTELHIKFAHLKFSIVSCDLTV